MWDRSESGDVAILGRIAGRLNGGRAGPAAPGGSPAAGERASSLALFQHRLERSVAAAELALPAACRVARDASTHDLDRGEAGAKPDRPGVPDDGGARPLERRVLACRRRAGDARRSVRTGGRRASAIAAVAPADAPGVASARSTGPSHVPVPPVAAPEVALVAASEVHRRLHHTTLTTEQAGGTACSGRLLRRSLHGAIGTTLGKALLRPYRHGLQGTARNRAWAQAPPFGGECGPWVGARIPTRDRGRTTTDGAAHDRRGRAAVDARWRRSPPVPILVERMP